MTDEQGKTERMVSVLITIRIDSVPLSAIADLEEEAFKVGDEWGASVDINKGQPRNVDTRI